MKAKGFGGYQELTQQPSKRGEKGGRYRASSTSLVTINRSWERVGDQRQVMWGGRDGGDGEADDDDEDGHEHEDDQGERGVVGSMDRASTSTRERANAHRLDGPGCGCGEVGVVDGGRRAGEAHDDARATVTVAQMISRGS